MIRHVSALVLVAPLAAQQTFVVDIAGSTSYQQVQAAINAATAGDIIEVLPGVYDPFTCSKALRIQGSPTSVIAGNGGTTTFTVSGIPAGSTCTISQLRMRSPTVPCICEPTMVVNQCPGLVVLDNLGSDSGSLEPKLQTTDAAAVLVNDSVIGPVTIFNGTAQLTRTLVTSASLDAGNNITLNNAELDMTDGSLWIRLSSSGYGIHLTNSTARLRSVNGISVTRTFPFTSWDFFGDAQSTVIYHPQTSFSFGMPDLGPFTSNQVNVVSSDDQPSLTVETAGPGGTVDVNLNYTPGVGFIVPFLSTPAGPFQVPGISGNLCAGGPFLVSLGTIAMTSNPTTTSFGVPNVLALGGQPFVIQGIAINTGLVATNAVGFTIR